MFVIADSAGDFKGFLLRAYSLWYQGKNHAEGTNGSAYSGIVGYDAMNRKIAEEAKKNLHFFS